jgi:hypothetical protein
MRQFVVLTNTESSMRHQAAATPCLHWERGFRVQFKNLTPHGCIPVALLVAVDPAPASLGAITVRCAARLLYREPVLDSHPSLLPTLLHRHGEKCLLHEGKEVTGVILW